MTNQNIRYSNVATEFITAANGVKFAFRRMGVKQGIPVIYFNHLTANLDNCDPRIMDSMAVNHEIISFDYRGIGMTSGEDAGSIRDMAKDSLAFIQALGLSKVDVMAFSMGGFIAQEILELAPGLVRKIILAGTGPRGGKGISDVVRLTYWGIFRGYINFVDPKYFLFFNSSRSGKTAAREFLKRLKERTENRDTPVKLKNLKAQLHAIKVWGNEQAADLSKILIPVLVVNGDNDRMVPTPNSYDLAKRLPNSQLHIYENAAHGAIFQNHDDFVKRALAFFQVS